MFKTNSEFEDEVRRIARLLWPSAEFAGAIKVDERERDAVFETDEFIHAVECTVSRGKDKAIEDCNKLEKLIRKLGPRHPRKFIRGWFITLNEPTADQRVVVNKAQGRIVACSFDQFRSKLIDARSYLSHRKEYAFGSVKDPESGRQDYQIKYVPLDILDDAGELHAIDTIADGLEQGNHVVITGDYGAGKSSTAREIFFSLAKRFWSNKTLKFPVMLNLRDHHGQTEPVEALERHARKIAFSPETSLVRAWRAGFIVVILDGFDEIASAGWAGKTATLRDLRYRSMELVRRFVREAPNGSGLLLTGRAHFFDNAREMKNALGLMSQAKILEVTEFSTSQVKTFLENAGWKDDIVPDWLPTRPLLLAYLAARGLLSRTIETDFVSGPAVGWHELLDRISHREAEIEAGIDATTVRRLIEQLSAIARSTVDGLGPLSPDTITEAFREVCGYSPDDRGAVLLQRLPGLGASQMEDGSRVFIDRDFAEAARGGAVFTFIETPHYTKLHTEAWQSALRPLGAEMAAYRCRLANFNAGKITAAIIAANKDPRCQTLCADLLLVLKQLGVVYNGPQIYLQEVLIDELRLDDSQTNFHNVEFQNSLIGLLEVSYDYPVDAMPLFRKCYFSRVEGRTGKDDLPLERFSDCTFDEFEHTSRTTKAILSLSVPLSTKVLLTILKKLYAQSGSGRKEVAFYRGLDARAQQLVPSILELLRREEFAVKSRHIGDEPIWLPTRTASARRRALRILASPTVSLDPLIAASREIN